MPEEPETTITPARHELFNKIGDILGDQETEDVIFALCDHLAMALAFACDDPESVEAAIRVLIPDMMKTVRANWEQSRRARYEAERLAERDHG